MADVYTAAPLLQGYLRDWKNQLQTRAQSGALLDAASRALDLKTVHQDLKDLNKRLEPDICSDKAKTEVPNGCKHTRNPSNKTENIALGNHKRTRIMPSWEVLA